MKIKSNRNKNGTRVIQIIEKNILNTNFWKKRIKKN